MNLSYGLFEYDYLPIIRKYVIFYKGLDEKVAYEIEDPKEFYNYVMCLVEDPSLPYTIRIEYFIKCKGLKGKNVVRVSKDYFINFFRMQNYNIWHEDYITRRYYDQFQQVEYATLSESNINEDMLSLDPLEILIRNEFNNELQKECEIKLSTDEMIRIYKYLYENKNISQIAREFGIKRQSVQESIHNGLSKLKKNFFENF